MADPPPPVPVTPLPPATPRAETLQDAEHLLAQGRAQEACQRGEKLLADAPDSAPVLRFLGRCYMRTRRREDAVTSYRRYLELAPDAPDATLIRSIVD